MAQAKEIANGWQQRDYQTHAHDAVFKQFVTEHTPSTLVVMPTGTGKTVLAARIAATNAKIHGRRTLFLAHRELLVNQAADTLSSMGLDVAIEMAGQNAIEQAAIVGHPTVVVGTVQTLQGERLARWSPDYFGLVVTDECHRAASPQHVATVNRFAGAWHLGITATPEGASGKIGNVFKTQAYRYSIAQAVIDGWLVKPRRERCKLAIDLRGIRMSGGDFNAESLAERIGPSVSLLADGIKQRLGGRFSVVFTPSVFSALALAAALRADSPSGPGVSAEYCAGDSGRFGVKKSARKELLERFQQKELQVLVCCDLLIEGWDARHCTNVVICRPTRLRHRFTQMVGRGMRRCPEIGKEECVIIDFDWQCDDASRDLVGPVEYLVADDPDFDDCLPERRERVIKDAQELADRGLDILEAIKKAKEFEAARQLMPTYLHGMEAKFEVEHYDPLAISHLCGFKLKKQHDYVRPGLERAYRGQIDALKRLGVRDTENLSVWGASKLLRELEKRAKWGGCSYEQVHQLVKAGIEPSSAREMTVAQADVILKNPANPK